MITSNFRNSYISVVFDFLPCFTLVLTADHGQVSRAEVVLREEGTVADSYNIRRE